jgi:hypothetical protein
MSIEFAKTVPLLRICSYDKARVDAKAPGLNA